MLLIILFGCMSGHLAKRKNRSAVGWFFMGIFFHLFSLLFLFLLLPLPPKTKKPRKPPKVTVGKWFYLDSRKHRIGPLSWDALLEKLETIHDNEEVWVWKRGMKTWEKIKNLPMLYEAVQEKKNTMP